MSISLLPICSKQKIAIRDGLTGEKARLLLPFYKDSNGAYTYWYASGQQYAFPTSTIAQDQSITMQGTAKPNTFTKGAGICLG